MKRIRKAVLASLGLLPFFMPIDAAFAAESTNSSDEILSSASDLPWRKARFSIEAQSGSRTIGTLDAMIPFMGDDDFMVYADLITKFGSGANNQNGNTWEGNLGLGIRRVNDSETAIYGAYAFFDYINSVNNNKFQQVTVGVERLGLTWDFRANAYVPMGIKEYTNNVYTGGSIVIDEHNLIEYYKSVNEKATTGGDIEIGRTLGSQKFRGYLAAYTFGPDLTGPRLRFEYQLNDRFALNAALQYDKDRGTQYLFGARFTVGGAKAKNSGSIYSRMTDKIVRDVDVVTKQTTVDIMQVEKDRFWLVDTDKKGSGGDGTLDNPYAYIDEAIEAAPAGAIIFVKGSDGSIHQIRDQLTLKDGQIVWGGDKPLYWDFTNSTPVFTANNDALLIYGGSGVRQTLGGNIEMANNSGLYNFDITTDGAGPDNTGILVNDKNNVVIGDVSISGFQSGDSTNLYSAIHVIGDNASVSFADVQLSNNDIGVLVEGGNVGFNNLTINNSTAYGMQLLGGKTSAAVISIDKSGINGIYANNNASLTANSATIDNSLQSGIYAANSSVTVYGDLSIDHSGTIGLDLSATNFYAGSISVDNSIVNGINIEGGSLVVGGAVDVDNSGGRGLSSRDATLTINGALNINNSAMAGLLLIDNTSTFGSVAIDNSASEDGFYQLRGTTTINGSVTVDHTVTGNGIYQSGGLFTANGSVTVANSAQDGFYSENGTTNLNGSGSNLSNNAGNGLSVTGSTVNINGLTTNSNILDGIAINNGTVIGTGLAITDNGLNGITLTGADSFLNLAQSSIDANAQHALQIKDGAAAVISDVTVTKNGGDANKAEDLADAYSAIQVDGILNATHITVTENAAGIELLSGSIAINDNAFGVNQRSNISNNSGYGVWSHGTDSEHTIRISNTDINGNTQLENQKNSGYGIYADDLTYMSLQNVAINDNANTGMWIRSGEVEGSAVNINRNGQAVNGGTSLDDAAYGLRVDEKADQETSVRLQDAMVKDNFGAGVFANGGLTTFDDSNITGNQIGIILSRGTAYANNSHIDNNIGYGIQMRDNGTPADRSFTLTGSTIENTSSNGADRDGTGVMIQDNSNFYDNSSSISDNAGNGIYIADGNVLIAGHLPGSSSPTDYDSFIARNGKDGVQQEAGHDVQLNVYGTIIEYNGNNGISVGKGAVVNIYKSQVINQMNGYGVKAEDASITIKQSSISYNEAGGIYNTFTDGFTNWKLDVTYTQILDNVGTGLYTKVGVGRNDPAPTNLTIYDVQVHSDTGHGTSITGKQFTSSYTCVTTCTFDSAQGLWPK